MVLVAPRVSAPAARFGAAGATRRHLEAGTYNVQYHEQGSEPLCACRGQGAALEAKPRPVANAMDEDLVHANVEARTGDVDKQGRQHVLLGLSEARCRCSAA